ncbi:hypothetical protein [Streptomyces sp. NPDC059533]|uniref:hypothetical protein n=1 Tax=unclassified Streptomyces TaxID=2593676 RepID=UPI003686BCF1
MALVIAVGGLLVVGFLSVILAVVFLIVMMVLRPGRHLDEVRRQIAHERARHWALHQERVGAWQQMVHEHWQAQLRRQAAADTWFPLLLGAGQARVDVIGGTGDGWASLLATVGGPVLHDGQALLVLDMTEEAIALELAELAAHRRVPAEYIPFPAAALRTDLGAEFDPEELADSLAGAFATMRPPGTDTDLVSIDATVIRTVARRLDVPLTYPRLTAGLAVLLRLYEPAADGSGPLTAPEVTRLTEAIDSVGSGERRINELHHMKDQLDALSEVAGETAASAAANRAVAEWWVPGQLTVVSTDGLGPRRKDLADRILFFRILHALRSRTFAPGTGTLVVAGADHLGRDALEFLARQARTAGIRLVLFLEHLREGTVHLVGGAGSATVFMRMGNGEEAQAAAEFIGREHTFIVNQLTQQIGETLTTGRGDSYGEQSGESSTHTSGSLLDKGGSSTSRGTSLSRSWQQTVNSSQAISTTRGETSSRLYEFRVEPTQLQALPPTGLILVETTPASRRVAFGDCNPGISMMPRVSPLPR